MTNQEQKQIPFGDDKAKGNDRDSEPSAQNDEQTKANTEILAFDFSQARMTNKKTKGEADSSAALRNDKAKVQGQMQGSFATANDNPP